MLNHYKYPLQFKLNKLVNISVKKALQSDLLYRYLRKCYALLFFILFHCLLTFPIILLREMPIKKLMNNQQFSKMRESEI